MSELQRHRLADLYVISSGITTTKDLAGHGAPFVAYKDIYNNYFIPDQLTELMDATREQQEKFSVRTGDVFLTRTSETLDELAMSSVALRDYPNATFSGFAKRLRPNDPANPYPRFMGFFLRSNYFRRIINNVTTMTTRASFNEAIFSRIEIDLPDLGSQVRIGDLLYSIEQKIELNDQVNDNLQAMVLTHYMHHFFRKVPNGQLSHVLVESPKSEVKVRDAKESTGCYPFFTSGDSVLRWDEPLASGRTILLNTGGNAGVKFYVGEIAYSTDTWAFTARDDLADYIYLLLHSISPELDQKYFLGTGLRHLQKALLKKRPIYVPAGSELDEFNAVAVPAMSMISENQRENRCLEELRDWLVPMLMNEQAAVGGFR